MAFASLNPFRDVWSGAGLKYLLLPQEAPPGLGFCQTGKVAQTQNVPQDAYMRKFAGRKAQSAPDRFARAAPRSGIAPKPELSVKKTAQSFKAIPVEAWPAIWQQQFSNTRKAQIAWTWWELGLDLLAAKNAGYAAFGNAAERKQRSTLLKKLLSDLGHPGGTHTFWPACMPDGDKGQVKPNFDCFWSGVEFLKCRGIIILGSPAANAVMLDPVTKPLQQMRQFGKFIWILWDPNIIASRHGVYERVLDWIRFSLKSFIRL